MTITIARAMTVSLLLVSACAAAAASQQSPALPVTVGLAGGHAYLRAGPGEDFYPTERLVRGAEVEVWSIDESGWCAVRPVAGSYSWLRAADVEPEDGAARAAEAGRRGGYVGVVVTDGAVARVGSQLNDLRHVTQVALEAGERVRVIEEVVVACGRHAGTWVRIAPPAGEFRWVPGEDLALPEGLAVEVEPPPAGGLAAAGEAVAAIRDAGTAVSRAIAEVDVTAPAGGGTAPGLLPTGNAFTRLVSGWLPRGTNVFDPPPAAAPAAVGAGAAAVPADELADIDLALSLAVTGQTADWNLAPLRERLRLAATRAVSPAERTRAQAIDARLARFESIQAGQQALAQGGPAAGDPVRIGGMWSSLAALGSRPIRPGVLPGGAPAGGQPTWTPPDQAETTGRLATVISRRPEAPRWALVDDQNNVLVFVTPQAGVNLAPLVGQQVTVRGAKGFMPEYKRPYVVAAEARTRLAATPPAAADRTQ
ncbi:MAG: hypothetical protein ACKOZU_03845 [Planctomycetaceae bacterium]